MTASVCFLGYELHPPWHEGTRVLTRNQLDALAEAGNRVSAVSTLGRGNDRMTTHDIRYVRETFLGNLARQLGLDPNVVDVHLWAKLAIALRREVARMEVDLVHAGFASHTLFSFVCQLPPSVPFVAQLFGKLENRTLVQRLGTPGRVDGYVTCSPRDVGNLRELGVPEDKIHQIPPAVPTTEGDRLSGRERLGVEPDDFVVGYLGNSDLGRLPPSLVRRLDAFAGAEATEILVVTKRIEQPQLLDHSHLTVLERSLDELEKRETYAAADVWIFPFDFDDPDNAPVIDPPLSVLEAMAAGRSVVATDSLSIANHIRDGETGLLVDPGADNEFLDILGHLRDHPDELTRLGDAAREYMSDVCNPRRAATALQQVYEQVLRL